MYVRTPPGEGSVAPACEFEQCDSLQERQRIDWEATEAQFQGFEGALWLVSQDYSLGGFRAQSMSESKAERSGFRCNQGPLLPWIK